MRTFRQAVSLVAIGTLSLISCQDQEGLNEGTIKLGGKLAISNTTCKTFSQSAQKFFLDQVTGGEREVLAAELKQRIDEAQPTMIVDVRPLTEFSAAHIPGAINVPLDILFNQALCPNSKGCCEKNDDDDDQGEDDDRDLTSSPSSASSPISAAAAPEPVATGGSRPSTCKPPILPTDGTPIILVSSNGHAASMAAGVLGSIGYNVYVLRFGMISWVASSDVKVHRNDRVQRIQGLGGPVEL